MKPYRICLLGGLQFHDGQQTVTRFRTQKTATLLAYLARHRGPQPREVLADLLWPDAAPDAARHSLRMALSSLRSQLEGGAASSHAGRAPLFETTRFSIGLRADAVSTDIDEFESALKSARHATGADERARHYSAAIELASGAFLPGFYDDWCLEAAARVEAELDDARQFLRNWNAANEHAPAVAASRAGAEAGAPAAVARIADAAKLATFLVYDGADLTRAARQQIKALGGAQLKTAAHAPHAWHFDSSSAALEGAELVPRGERRLALCTGEISARNQSGLWARALGLLESAAAGQSLCCEATALFERGRTEIECRDVGVYHLPGAAIGAAPERVFQVSWAGDETRVFAPLRARAAHGANVPRALDPFFGRARELSELRAQLAGNRLITLLGAGGAGKTRLALQLAANLEIERAAPFYGAVFWIALADVPDATGIAPALCDALRIECTGAPAAFDAATAALHRASDTLLIFDNFEHLVEDGAVWIERLLERAPRARALLTSRRLLGVPGEIEYEVAPLSVPDAHSSAVAALQTEPSVQLFCDRARGARPDFALTAHNAPAVAALCRQLEGIPLAIELAAARVGQMSPARILAHLQARAPDETPEFERLDLLRNSARTAAARHRTLRAALRWSVDELTLAQRELLTRLCVFRGGCTAHAAAQVCQAPAANEQLEALRARSLLGRTYMADEPRYSMLETVRQYAHELAHERGEIEDLRRRHALYFLHWAQNEAPRGNAPDAPARLQSWQRVRAQSDNLRAALRWARQHEPMTAILLILACQDFSGAHLSRDELDIIAPLHAVQTPEVESGVLAGALKLAAVQSAHRGDIDAQNEFALRHLDLIRELPDAPPDILAWAYFNWGSARHRSGHASIARAALHQSLELFAQLEAPQCHQCRAWTLIEMGNTAFDAGDLGTAAADFEQCDRAFAESGDRDGQASARAQLATVCFHARDHARAAQLWPQVNAIMRELGDEREHEWRRHGEGKHAIATGDLERGRELLLRALRAFESDGQKLGVLRSLLALSYYWLERHNSPRARRLLQVEARARRQLDWPPDKGWEAWRAQLWKHAGASDDETDLPSLEWVVAHELAATTGTEAPAE